MCVCVCVGGGGGGGALFFCYLFMLDPPPPPNLPPPHPAPPPTSNTKQQNYPHEDKKMANTERKKNYNFFFFLNKTIPIALLSPRIKNHLCEKTKPPTHKCPPKLTMPPKLTQKMYPCSGPMKSNRSTSIAKGRPPSHQLSSAQDLNDPPFIHGTIKAPPSHTHTHIP